MGDPQQQPLRKVQPIQEAIRAPAVSDPVAPAVFKPPPRVRRAVMAQDGHSAGEQLLYQALWNAATPEGADTRLLCIGYGGMESLTRMDRSNCKNNIQSLIEKLSVDVVSEFSVQKNQGNTYRIYSYAGILRRRRAAGMEWVVRNRGVRFVDAPTGNSPIGNSDEPIGNTPIGDPQTPMGESPIGPLGDLPTAIRNRNLEELTSSSERAVAAALRRYSEAVDDDAVRRLISACIERAPDATAEEIDAFIQTKGVQLTRSRHVANPVGWLLEVVPKCFEGESFRQFRAARAEGREVASAGSDVLDSDTRLALEAMLEDPKSSEQDRAFARRLLEQIEG